MGPSIGTDASLSGYGVLYGRKWCAGYLDSCLIPPQMHSTMTRHLHWLNLHTGGGLSINVLELLPIWLACVLWGAEWTGLQVNGWTDNTQVLSAVNKGSSTSTISMALLREIFWYSVAFDFHLVAKHVPGVENVAADFLSRINQNVVMNDFVLCLVLLQES